ncbi:hypothetical protein M0R45_019545 [Rubus argutus]|uniref:Uncharacterized protein n=1 Tax=Rubus argutus TaxID=59490 RepID=A0AAW1X6E2_RUBAR
MKTKDGEEQRQRGWMRKLRDGRTGNCRAAVRAAGLRRRRVREETPTERSAGPCGGEKNGGVRWVQRRKQREEEVMDDISWSIYAVMDAAVRRSDGSGERWRLENLQVMAVVENGCREQNRGERLLMCGCGEKKTKGKKKSKKERTTSGREI